MVLVDSSLVENSLIFKYHDSCNSHLSSCDTYEPYLSQDPLREQHLLSVPSHIPCENLANYADSAAACNTLECALSPMDFFEALPYFYPSIEECNETTQVEGPASASVISEFQQDLIPKLPLSKSNARDLKAACGIQAIPTLARLVLSDRNTDVPQLERQLNLLEATK